MSYSLAHLAVPYGGRQDARLEPKYIQIYLPQQSNNYPQTTCHGYFLPVITTQSYKLYSKTNNCSQQWQALRLEAALSNEPNMYIAVLYTIGTPLQDSINCLDEPWGCHSSNLAPRLLSYQTPPRLATKIEPAPTHKAPSNSLPNHQQQNLEPANRSPFTKTWSFQSPELVVLSFLNTKTQTCCYQTPAQPRTMTFVLPLRTIRL
jgi:hypothetical protein